MDTRNWFGEHAATIKMIALAGGIALAVIIVLDLMTHKKGGTTGSATTGAAPATGADVSPATSGTSATSTLQNPGETYISILEDYSSHVGSNSNDITTRNITTNTTRNTTLPPVPVAAAPTQTPQHAPAPAPAPAPVSHPASTGGATVPVPTPHPAQHYTVRSGDTLWGIAQRFLGNGADWRELYNWNRGVVGSNPNLIFPGEQLTIN